MTIFKNLTGTDMQMYVIMLLTFWHSLIEWTIVSTRSSHQIFTVLPVSQTSLFI